MWWASSNHLKDLKVNRWNEEFLLHFSWLYHSFNFLESSTLLGQSRTFVKSVKISLIPKVSFTVGFYLFNKCLLDSYYAASTGDAAMHRTDRACKNTGSLFLSINTCHLLLKNL